MEKLKKSSFLKILCYILIPIISLSLFFSITFISLKDEYGTLNNEEYVKTEDFSREYLSSIIYNVNLIKQGYTDKVNNGNYDKIEEHIYYNRYNGDYYGMLDNYIKFIIIDKNSNDIFTNIQSSNYLEEVKKFQSNEIYWNYENGKVITNIDIINQDNVKYMVLPIDGINTLENFDVYTYIDMNAFEYSNNYAIKMALFDVFNKNPNMAEILIPVDIVLLSIICIYLIWSIGHSNKSKGIYLNSLDRFPYELLLIVFGIILTICIIIAETMIVHTDISINLLLSLLMICFIGGYISLAIIIESTIKRLKAREFFHTFLVYKLYKSIKNKISKTASKVLDKSDSQKKIIICYIAFVIISSILGLTFFTGISFLILIAFWIWVLYKLLEYNKKLNEIKFALKEIYEGNNDIHINLETLKGTLKELATYVNDVSDGFANAVNESLKSERLKTELITNVSHDIKTPLTSIINYVDLLKREDIKDEKIKEYIKVLDQKSQRLKKLIDDLVEASKASSGNVRLNVEEINLNELLKQLIGEFEDKFNEKNLIVDLELKTSKTVINADNRYMYRIIENLFSNISKYSMENTRVYIKLASNDEDIILEIKNVSKEKLNISADELMQRFVRGDKSRFTEGSGLGLSIAKSLTELQGGKFSIDIDGDLFKVIIKWNK